MWPSKGALPLTMSDCQHLTPVSRNSATIASQPSEIIRTRNFVLVRGLGGPSAP